MQPLQPEQAVFLLHGIFLPGLKNEARVTKSVIEAIPTDKGDYRPDPAAKSALELAWHICAAEHRFLAGVASGEFDFNPFPRPDSVRNPADIAHWYDQSFNADFDHLTKLSGDQLVKKIDFRGIFQHPAVVYVQISMLHSVHHRGQLSCYLRPMGGKVPAIYGESYDSAEARKAAQAGTR
jgi:uncharacterized damage-inducible protein DinB